ncbi:AAA family ATPase, partial [Oligoflexia bacterium]|nr:AAA family ATPase [Oligoflexia bacterium]
MFYPRKEAKIIREHIASARSNKDVLLVGGARQVGKSTLVLEELKQIDNKLVLNLAENRSLIDDLDQLRDFSEFEELLTDRFGFNSRIGTVLYLDEAQMSTALGNFVRFMKEKWEHTTVIISGSMIANLFKDRFPVGRVNKLTLRPFTFEEYLKAREKDSLLEFLDSFQMGMDVSETRHKTFLAELNDYFLIGGLPAVISVFEEGGNWKREREKILSNYRDDFALFFGIEQ